MGPDAPRRDLVRKIRSYISDIDFSAKSQNKYDGFEDFLESEFGLTEGEIVVKGVSEGKQVGNRLGEAGKKKPTCGVFVLKDARILQSMKVAAVDNVGLSRAIQSLIVFLEEGDSAPQFIVGTRGHAFTERLVELFPSVEFVPSSDHHATSIRSFTPPARGLTIEPRLRRMVRIAIASSPAVMLVGPPGTGKGVLLRETLADIAANPTAYGLTRAPKDAVWVTPEENWTTRELVGGETLGEDNSLRFRPGHILDAIRADKWLVLDEANRADMDKIFGGLLTWLTTAPGDPPVKLGAASTHLRTAAVELAWTDDPECSVDGLEHLAAPASDESDTTDKQLRLDEAPRVPVARDSDWRDGPSFDPPAVRFLAGSDWRLLGTYNALDAQRVFRFGQALGRRFIRIPVVPMPPAAFKSALSAEVADLPPVVLETLSGLYAAHYESEVSLGPAIFFRAHQYVRAGLTLSPPDSEATGVEKASEELAQQLLAEAYLAAAGTWLAKMNPEAREKLRQTTLENQLFSASEWEWLEGHLPALA